MKTIECAFISNREITLESAQKHKQYSFNTKDDLQPGNILSVKDYAMLLMVTRIHKRVFQYYNPDNGVLNNVLTPTYSGIIKELTDEEDQENKLFYKLIK